jgi:hypothetical protein
VDFIIWLTLPVSHGQALSVVCPDPHHPQAGAPPAPEVAARRFGRMASTRVNPVQMRWSSVPAAGV